MSTEYVADRTVTQERDEPRGARAIRTEVVDHQATGQQEITREQQRGAIVVEDQVRGLMTRCSDDIDGAIAERDMSDAFRPFRQTQRGLQVRYFRRHDFDSGQRCELRVGRAMIAMTVSVEHEQRDLRVTLARQEVHHSLRQADLRRIFDGAGVDQMCLIGADQQILQGCFEVGAETLSQNVGLRLILMNLQRGQRSFLAVLGAFAPAHLERPGDRLAPGAHRQQQESESKRLLHVISCRLSATQPLR